MKAAKRMINIECDYPEEGEVYNVEPVLEGRPGDVLTFFLRTTYSNQIALDFGYSRSRISVPYPWVPWAMKASQSASDFILRDQYGDAMSQTRVWIV